MGVWQKEIITVLLLLLATVDCGWNNRAFFAVAVPADAGHHYASDSSD